MPFSRSLTVIGCHCEGEVGDVITGGVLDVPGKTMFEKLQYMSTQKDDLRQLLLNEPRVLLETGMVPMKEPVTHLALDTAAGLIKVTAECEAGKCKSVEFDNIASFVFELDFKVKVRGLGEVSVDIAYGGMMYVVTDATALGLRVDNQDATRLIDIGERIKRAVEAVYTPVHPENPGIKGFSVIVFTEPLRVEGGCKVASNATVVSPGRFDRSPCGSGTSARLAVLHARGQITEGETFKHRSILGTEFICRIRGTATVGKYPAVLPTIKGRAWITSFKTVVLDSSDPFPEGFRVGDQWYMQPN
ncbi:hypothetical protein N7470_008693 [Penicillium chermesinum]|nr:hypothetical protein N7470_008693 [Penicillium chermesinum]